jgi:hypothetical protein
MHDMLSIRPDCGAAAEFLDRNSFFLVPARVVSESKCVAEPQLKERKHCSLTANHFIATHAG